MNAHDVRNLKPTLHAIIIEFQFPPNPNGSAHRVRRDSIARFRFKLGSSLRDLPPAVLVELADAFVMLALGGDIGLDGFSSDTRRFVEERIGVGEEEKQ